jgi:hypothetical protein
MPYFLFYLSLAAPLAAMLIGIRQRFTLLWFYAATGLLFDFLATFLKLQDLNNKWVANLFVLGEFVFISLYYKKEIFKISKLFIFFFCTVIAAFIAHTILRSVFDFNTFGYSLFCFIYLIYGFFGFYFLVKESKQIFLGKSSFFWANVAVFVYASSVFLLFLFRYYLQEKDQALFNTLWTTFYLVINIQRYVLIGIALNKKPEV